VEEAANARAAANLPVGGEDEIVILSEAKDSIPSEDAPQTPSPGKEEGAPEGRAGAASRKRKRGKAPLTPEEQAKRKRRTRRTAIRLTLKILIYPLIAYLVLTLVIGVYQIHDNDMFPSLRDGDLVITYKLVEGYFTGDVVIYEAEGKIHVGRICAVPGDEVYIMEDGYYELNGSIPHEDIYYPTRSGKGLTYPYTVQEGEVFILGDMRLQATDSRALGAISIEQLKGKVVLLLFRGRGF